MSIVELAHVGFTGGRQQQPLLVLKRDGRRLRFEAARIETAFVNAFVAVNGELNLAHERTVATLLAEIFAELAERFDDAVKTYEIQSVVEHVLLTSRQYDVARAYVDYRVDRDFARSKATDLNHTISTITPTRR